MSGNNQSIRLITAQGWINNHSTKSVSENHLVNCSDDPRYCSLIPRDGCDIDGFYYTVACIFVSGLAFYLSESIHWRELICSSDLLTIIDNITLFIR